MKDKKYIFSLCWVVIGTILWTLGLFERIEEYWASMGFALLVVGSLQLLKRHRINKNPAYKERMEIEATDERNLFIHGKAWSWAGSLFVILASLAVIVLRAFGEEVWSTAAAYAVCLMLILYWGSYWVLKKKY